MLFNSFIFLFGFLPLTLLLTFLAGRHGSLAKIVLTLLSLGFYAWWRPVHLPLLLGSIVFNYFVGGQIQKTRAAGEKRAMKTWLIFGILADVGMLAWFKYSNFIADNLTLATGHDFTLHRIALPLAISFFTFQKLAYLIDSARGEAKPMSFLDFSLFAAFFPQLIAGPIVHYKEVVPQLQSRLFGRFIARNVLIGLVIFAIGLFKKTVIADSLSAYVEPFYASATGGATFDIVSGWLAALTFTFQLYFDFSGYSDMAIGLARMFGVKLPLNFHSPLRARGIIDYWRRWHMTLQRFITAYIFQPLSLPLNRLAAEKRLGNWPAFGVGIALPAFITFVVVGIWHGAGWTFVLFGGLHATYICINEFWRERHAQRRRAYRKAKKTMPKQGVIELGCYHLITLVAIMFGNVLFRATSVDEALSIWQGMVGLAGVGAAPVHADLIDAWMLSLLVISALIIFLLPNTQQIMARFDPAYNWREWRDTAPALIRWQWKPNATGLIFAGITLFLGIMFIQRGQAVFLYFNF